VNADSVPFDDDLTARVAEPDRPNGGRRDEQLVYELGINGLPEWGKCYQRSLRRRRNCIQHGLAHRFVVTEWSTMTVRHTSRLLMRYLIALSMLVGPTAETAIYIESLRSSFRPAYTAHSPL